MRSKVLEHFYAYASEVLGAQVMEGDNQWLCEELGEKVDALKGPNMTGLGL